MSFSQFNRWIGIFLFIISTILYLSTAESTASFWDSGEYIAASYKLEIPHPPGAPLFLLFGRIFSFLSFGDVSQIALAINALSAVTSGLAVMFLYWTIVLIAQKLMPAENKKESWVILIAGIIGALTFAFSDTFWTSATETELYAFSTFLTALVFWAILKWDTLSDESIQNKWLIFIAYLMGLSVGVHLLNLLTIPALALVYYFKKYDKTTVKGFITTITLSLLFLVGILYGLVGSANLAKNAEILFVNSFNLPFGSGALTFIFILLAGWITMVVYTQNKAWFKVNTMVLAVGFIAIGYSSYTLVLIRSNNHPPINQNSPDNLLGLIYYLNMEQYGSRPLLYGNHFESKIKEQKQGNATYEIREDKYQVKDHGIKNIYAEKDNMIFPRMYSKQSAQHTKAYREITGLQKDEKPTFGDNIQYFLSHQLNHMYWRYFLWNFSGKEGSKQGAKWLSPLATLDEIPNSMSSDKARNNYFMWPLILGIIGCIFLYYTNKNIFYVTGILFLMTGIALVVYINAPPIEPRERDYIYVGSFYAFSIWVGLGLLGLIHFTKALFKTNLKASYATACCLGLLAPSILLYNNFDDHDRSDRFFSVDQAKNLLTSCEENAILFTGGDNDTFPLWYLQEVEGYRTDVRVIVLSYANADWYVNQFYESCNQSAPLPLRLTQDNYKQGGLNDYLPLMPRQNIEGPISTKQYLELLKREHKSLQVSSGHSHLNTLPADSFSISSGIDKDNFSTLERHKPLLTQKIEIKTKGRGIEKKDLVILDLIDSNHWNRPIYFNHTSLNSVNLELKNHVVQEGSTFRLLPLTNPNSNKMLINEEKMYDQLVNKGHWRNLDNEDIYYDDYYQGYVISQRSSFNTLAQTLIDTGKVEMAKETLKKSIAYFPNKSIPFNIASVTTTDLLLTLHDKDSADHIAKILLLDADQYLEYAFKSNEGNQNEIMRKLYILRELAIAYHSNGYRAESSSFAKLYEKHSNRVNS